MRPKFIGKNGTKAKGRNEHSLDETGWWHASSGIVDHQSRRGGELMPGADSGVVRGGRSMNAGWPTVNRSEFPGN